MALKTKASFGSSQSLRDRRDRLALIRHTTMERSDGGPDNGKS